MSKKLSPELKSYALDLRKLSEAEIEAETAKLKAPGFGPVNIMTPAFHDLCRRMEKLSLIKGEWIRRAKGTAKGAA